MRAWLSSLLWLSPLLLACGATAEPAGDVVLLQSVGAAPSGTSPGAARSAAVPDEASRFDLPTQLVFAIGDDDAPKVEALLVAHPELCNGRDDEGNTPLMEAGYAGSPAATRVLLKRGATVDAVNKRGQTALERALDFSHLDVANILLDHRPVIPKAALAVAAREGDAALVDRLLAMGVSITATDQGCHALHAVAKYGTEAMIRKLVKLGAPIDAACDNDGFTPLIVAAQEANEPVARALLDLGARTETRDHNQRTALHWAAYGYRPAEVHLYRELGKPHDTIYRPPAAPLAMKALLDKKASIDAVDREGNTPLHEAVMMEASTAVELLVARGAKRTLRNNDGKTPLDLAKARKLDAIVAMLSGP